MKLKNQFGYYAKIAIRRLGWVAGQLELTTKCFQHCRGCMSHEQSPQEFSLMNLVKVYNQLAAIPTFEHLTLTGGDPQAWLPLDAFLKIHLHNSNTKMALQLNCALTQPIKDATLWCEAVTDFKISLDGCTVKTYQRIRGDKSMTPRIVMDRCWELDSPGIAFNITVYPENLFELYDLVRYIDSHHQQGMPMRKVMITAGIGDRRGTQGMEFHNEWLRQKQLILADETICVHTSFHELWDEDELLVRDVCEKSEMRFVRCWAGMLGFHIKPDGTLYPCCIVGGEVSETIQKFKIGNVHAETLKELYEKCKPHTRYKDESVCRNNCMYKQLQINMITQQASKITLALP